jgi:hypothetical protein
MTAAGFEHVVPEFERPQTYALERAATGTGLLLHIKPKPSARTLGLASCFILSLNLARSHWDWPLASY